jgi:hypothetical protein
MKAPVFDILIYWNRKLHIYIGLFLILFILLFSFSGLLFNHNDWEFASFWKERKEKEISIPVTIPVKLDSTILLQSFMKQLDISGEVNNVKLTGEKVSFRVYKPGIIHDITVNFTERRAFRKEMKYNFWGKIRTLHTFNGSNKAFPSAQPNWLITRIWRITMDLVATGLIFLCISSWIMWYKVRKNYSYGFLVLVSGIGIAMFFVFLLRLFI